MYKLFKYGKYVVEHPQIIQPHNNSRQIMNSSKFDCIPSWFCRIVMLILQQAVMPTHFTNRIQTDNF